MQLYQGSEKLRFFKPQPGCLGVLLGFGLYWIFLDNQN